MNTNGTHSEIKCPACGELNPSARYSEYGSKKSRLYYDWSNLQHKLDYGRDLKDKESLEVEVARLKSEFENTPSTPMLICSCQTCNHGFEVKPLNA